MYQVTVSVFCLKAVTLSALKAIFMYVCLWNSKRPVFSGLGRDSRCGKEWVTQQDGVPWQCVLQSNLHVSLLLSDYQLIFVPQSCNTNF